MSVSGITSTALLSKALPTALLTIIAIFAPVAPLMLLVGLAMMLDTVSGMWKAHKLGEDITSRKMGNLAIKMLVYQAAVLLFYLVDLYILQGAFTVLGNQPIFLTKVVAAWLVITEVKSLNENYAAVTGKDIIKNTASSIRKIREFYTEIKK